MRRDPWVLVGLGIVALTAIVASFTTLMHLAIWVGWDRRTGWLLPICLDVLALAAGRVWLSNFAADHARRYARAVSLAALAVSVVGNAIGHIVSMENASPVRVVLAIVVGSIPPIALGAVGHLATLATMQVTKPEPVAEVEKVVAESIESEPTPEPEPASVPEPEHRAQPRSRRRGRPKVKEPIARAFWDHEREAGRIPTGAKLAEVADADPTSGCNWRRAWLAEEEAKQATNKVGASFALVNA